MENNRVIPNRFLPTDTTPIFFAGRHKQVTDILLSLTYFTANDSGLHQHLHLLVGKSGVGKTTLLKYIYKQVINSLEMAHYIPVYVCLHKCKSIQELCRTILQSFEASFRDNSFRTGIVEAIIKDKKWLDELYHLAPSIIDNLRKNWENYTLFDFFHCLENLSSPKLALELIRLFNQICIRSNTSIFLIFDHSFHLFEKDETANALIEIFKEIDKYNSRYFTIFSIGETTFQNIRSNNFAWEQGGIPLILQSSNLFLATNESQISSQVNGLAKSLKGGEKFAVLGISEECDYQTTMGSLVSRCAADFKNVLIKCSNDNIEDFLCAACDTIMEQFESLNQPFKSKVPATAQMIKNEIQSKKNTKEILEYFGLLLTRLDKSLQQNMVIIFENFEKLIQQKRTFSSTSKLSATMNNQDNKFILPSVTFIKFFNILLQNTSRYKKISIVPVLKAPSYEFPIYNRTTFYHSLTGGFIWDLREFSINDTFQFVKETASKSGLLLDDTIINDLHKQSDGLPINLQLYCRFLVKKAEDGMTSEEQSTLRSNLLTKNKINNINLKTGYLVNSDDGRVRLSINKLFYETIKKKDNEIYKELCKEIEKNIGKELLQFFCVQDSLKIEDFKDKLKILEGLLFLLEQKLVIKKNGRAFLHNAIKKQLLLILEEEGTPQGLIRKTRVSTYYNMPKANNNSESSSSKTNLKHESSKMSISLSIPSKSSSQIISSLKSQPTLRPTEKKVRKDSFLKLNNTNTKMFKLEKQETGEFVFEYAISALDEEILPTSLLLKKIENNLELNQDSLAFQYIQNLSKYIAQKISLDNRKLFENMLTELEKQRTSQNKFNLLSVIENVFFQKNIAEQYIKERQYELLFHFYTMKHQFLGHHLELPKAIDYLFIWLENNLLDQNAKKYIHQVNGYLDKLQNIIPIDDTETILQEYTRLIYLLQKDSFYITKKMKDLLNENIPEPFQPYLMGCCLFFIRENFDDMIVCHSLHLLAKYIHNIRDKGEIKELIKCLPMHNSESVRKAFYEFLMQTIPIIKSDLHKEIFTMLFEALQQEEDIYNKIIKIIQGYILLVPREEACYLLKDSVQNPQKSVQFRSWLTLMGLWSILSEADKNDVQEEAIHYYLQNITSFLDKNKHTIISEFIYGVYEEQKDFVYDFVLSKLENTHFTSQSIKEILFIISNLTLDKVQQTNLNNMIIDLIENSVDKQREFALLLTCNKFFDQLQVFNTNYGKELEKILLKAKIYFFFKLTANDQETVWNNIFHLMVTAKNKSFYISTITDISILKNNDEIKNVENAFIDIITEDPYSIDAQTAMIFSGNIIAMFENQENSDLISVISHLLLTKNNCRIWESILSSFIGFSKEITIKEIETFIYKAGETYTDFSYKLKISFCDFLNYVLSNYDVTKICKNYIKNLLLGKVSNYKLAPVVIPIFIKHFNISEEIMDWLYVYQFNSYTWYVPFALYELNSDAVANIPNLSENYAGIKEIDGYRLFYNMIYFYYRLGMVEAVDEVYNSIQKSTMVPINKWQILKVKQEWAIKLCLKEEYIKTTLELQDLGFQTNYVN